MRRDPLRNFRFRLEIDGIQRGPLQRGDRLRHHDRRHRLPRGRRPDPRPQALRAHQVRQRHAQVGHHGLDGPLQLAPRTWSRARSERKTVAIVVQDEAGKDKARFEIAEAWPCKYDPIDLNAKGNEVSIETLELVQRGHRAHGVTSRIRREEGMNTAFQTEVEFTLPKGYVDAEGIAARRGSCGWPPPPTRSCRCKDPRVQQNPAYLTVIVLSRVITRLGSLADVHPGRDRGAVRLGPDLPPGPLRGAQRRRNASPRAAVCPKCEHRFEVTVRRGGEA